MNAARCVGGQVLGVAVVVAGVQVEEHPAHEVAQVDGGLGAVATDQFGAGGEARAACDPNRRPLSAGRRPASGPETSLEVLHLKLGISSKPLIYMESWFHVD